MFTTGGVPEFGRCTGAATSKEGTKTVYHGAYSNSSCTLTSVTGTGKYEWKPGVVKAGFTSTSAIATTVLLEAKGGTKVSCKAESGSGTITGAKTVGSAQLTLTGCESGGQKCTTTGLGEGTLQTKSLEGILGWESKEKKKPALDLYPIGHSGAFLEYDCGAHATVLTGSVLVVLKADKMATTQTLKYTASKGRQKPEHFEGLPPDVLENGLSEQVGLTMTATQTFEEAVEINAVV